MTSEDMKEKNSAASSAPGPFHGKRCIVTGATRGIGFAIARMLVENGADVAICGRSEASVKQAVDALFPEPAKTDKAKDTDKSDRNSTNKVVGKAADLKHIEQVRDFFEFVDAAFADGEFGQNRSAHLDVLINNAGVGRFGKVSEIRVDDWQETISTNLTGAFLCSREALRRFPASGGYIINMSSLAGRNSFAGGSAYNASKFGLNGFSEALMLDTRHDRVRVTTIMPGSVATDFGGATGADGGKASAGAPGSDWKIWPEDIAALVKMLLEMPPRTLVSSLEVRPSMPKRSA